MFQAGPKVHGVCGWRHFSKVGKKKQRRRFTKVAPQRENSFSLVPGDGCGQSE
jgi:hypothetical protein